MKGAIVGGCLASRQLRFQGLRCLFWWAALIAMVLVQGGWRSRAWPVEAAWGGTMGAYAWGISRQAALSVWPGWSALSLIRALGRPEQAPSSMRDT